ncbi:unnamed protein product [Caretta caretta]
MGDVLWIWHLPHPLPCPFQQDPLNMGLLSLQKMTELVEETSDFQRSTLIIINQWVREVTILHRSQPMKGRRFFIRLIQKALRQVQEYTLSKSNRFV